jgi:MoaA/NifB/PqqE/SkfB family radical SAM enzyme
MTIGDVAFSPLHVDRWNLLVHWHHLRAVLEYHRDGRARDEQAPMPITVEVNPIDYCNHACTWCFTSSHRETDRMDRETLVKLIEDLAEGGTRSVHFAGGGESTVFRGLVRPRNARPDSPWSILHLAKSRGLTAGMISNGSILGALDHEEIISDLSWIRFSIDAGTELRYQQTHRPKGHSLAGLHRWIGELTAARGSRSSPSIGASFIVDANTEEVRRELLTFCRDMASIGVDYVQIKPENSNRGAESTSFLKDLEEDIASSLGKTPTFAMLNAPYNSADNSDYCWYSYLGPVVGATGDAYVCCYTYGQEDFRYGRLDSATGFQDLWRSPERSKVADRIAPRSCVSCRHSSANLIMERLSQMDRASWDEISLVLAHVRAGQAVDSLTISPELAWLTDGFRQMERLMRGGLNGMLEYPTYRASLFVGLVDDAAG